MKSFMKLFPSGCPDQSFFRSCCSFRHSLATVSGHWLMDSEYFRVLISLLGNNKASSLTLSVSARRRGGVRGTGNVPSIVWCPLSPRHLSECNHIFAAAHQEKMFQIGVTVFARTRGACTRAHTCAELCFSKAKHRY